LPLVIEDLTDVRFWPQSLLDGYLIAIQNIWLVYSSMGDMHHFKGGQPQINFYLTSDCGAKKFSEKIEVKVGEDDSQDFASKFTS